VLEDPWAEAPEEAFDWTVSPLQAPDQPAYVEIDFVQGVPVAIDHQAMSLVELIAHLNALAGSHGVGRIDHVENRLVGIKSREVYEAPAALTLIKAHQGLEYITLTREVAQFKPILEQKYAELVYNGLWFSPLKKAVDAFILQTQATVTGTVRVKLFKGTASIVGSKSPYSLYNRGLATYAADDQFDHQAAVGFISLWGLPTRLQAKVEKQ
jgi:argininosuccinate synthase